MNPFAEFEKHFLNGHIAEEQGRQVIAAPSRRTREEIDLLLTARGVQAILSPSPNRQDREYGFLLPVDGAIDHIKPVIRDLFEHVWLASSGDPKARPQQVRTHILRSEPIQNTTGLNGLSPLEYGPEYSVRFSFDNGDFGRIAASLDEIGAKVQLIPGDGRRRALLADLAVRRWSDRLDRSTQASTRLVYFLTQQAIDLSSLKEAQPIQVS